MALSPQLDRHHAPLGGFVDCSEIGAHRSNDLEELVVWEHKHNLFVALPLGERHLPKTHPGPRRGGSQKLPPQTP
eukprot:3906995-Prymnesium_polylepis.2